MVRGKKNSAWPWLQGVWRRCSGGEDDSDSMGLSLVMVACSSSFAMVAMASVAVLRLVLAYGYAEKMMVADLVRWLALCTHGSRSPLCDGSVLQEGGEKMEVLLVAELQEVREWMMRGAKMMVAGG